MSLITSDITPAHLSDTEILSSLSGLPQESATDLLNKAGNLSTIFSLSTQDLVAHYKVTPRKAASIAAAGEFAKRALMSKSRETPMDRPDEVYDFIAPRLAFLPVETVVVCTLNARLSLIRCHSISTGTVSEASAHPREIFRPVIQDSAFAFVLAHNHPSGDPSPSHADHTVTRRIVDASSIMQVKFLDHIIIGRNAPGRAPYYSFREAGAIS